MMMITLPTNKDDEQWWMNGRYAIEKTNENNGALSLKYFLFNEKTTTSNENQVQRKDDVDMMRTIHKHQDK